MSGGEIGEISRFEGEVFERHRSRGGGSRERKEGDDGEDEWLCGGGCVWVPRGVDWEFTRKTGCKRAKEDRNRSGLQRQSSANRRGLKDGRAYIRWFQ